MARFLTLQPELWREVFSHVLVFDLPSLERTCRAFRQFLADTQLVWYEKVPPLIYYKLATFTVEGSKASSLRLGLPFRPEIDYRKEIESYLFGWLGVSRDEERSRYCLRCTARNFEILIMQIPEYDGCGICGQRPPLFVPPTYWTSAESISSLELYHYQPTEDELSYGSSYRDILTSRFRPLLPRAYTSDLSAEFIVNLVKVSHVLVKLTRQEHNENGDLRVFEHTLVPYFIKALGQPDTPPLDRSPNEGIATSSSFDLDEVRDTFAGFNERGWSNVIAAWHYARLTYRLGKGFPSEQEITLGLGDSASKYRALHAAIKQWCTEKDETAVYKKFVTHSTRGCALCDGTRIEDNSDERWLANSIRSLIEHIKRSHKDTFYEDNWYVWA